MDREPALSRGWWCVWRFRFVSLLWLIKTGVGTQPGNLNALPGVTKGTFLHPPCPVLRDWLLRDHCCWTLPSVCSTSVAWSHGEKKGAPVEHFRCCLIPDRLPCRAALPAPSLSTKPYADPDNAFLYPVTGLVS